MTEKQRAAIRAILDLQAERTAKMPTLTEFAERLGFHSKGAAHDLICGLATRGLIRRNGGGLDVTVQPSAMQVFKMEDGRLVRIGPS